LAVGCPSSLATVTPLAIIILSFSMLGNCNFVYSTSADNDNNNTPNDGQCDLPQPLTSTEASYASLANQSNNLVLKERIWISVRQIDFNEASWWVAHSNSDHNAVPQPVIPCTLLIHDSVGKISKVTQAIEGAENCKQGIEVCELPAGVSFGGEVEYKSSITDEEAHVIADEVSLVANKAILQQDDRYYLLQLFTTDENVAPQVRVEFLDDAHFGKGDSIHLEKGQSIAIPFTIRTFATYGKPANFTLMAGVHAKDSGLIFKIEPSPTFIIPERSSANGSLIITAGMDAMDGIYRFFVSGKDGWIRTCGEYTDYACPEIQVGNSTWEIFTSSGGGVGLGGKTPPEWLKVMTETDKDRYKQGETIVIKSYIENDGTDAVKLQAVRLIIDIGNATILPDPRSTTSALHILYTIDALSNSINDSDLAAVVVQPHSKVLLARPFYWNQELTGSVTSEGSAIINPGPVIITTTPLSVKAGNYTIHTSFAGYDGAVIYDSKNISITSEAPHAEDSGIVSKPEVWAYRDMQYPFIIGAGAAAALIIAFLTLRKRK
jgi:hypothetical protein